MSKRTSMLFIFLCSVVNTSFSEPSPSILFSTERLEDKQKLILDNSEKCAVKEEMGISVLTVEHSTDPYHEQSIDFRLAAADSLPGRSFILEIEFLDKGAGVIIPSFLTKDTYNGTWEIPERSCSYTRLNTLTIRSALFKFHIRPLNWENTTHPHLRITGLQYLKSIKIHKTFSEEEWTAATASVPVDVKPMLTLKRPMNIVCSAGVGTHDDLGTLETSLANMNELVPLAKVLGFNAIESYVRWDIVEPEEGRFDWTFYDAIVERIQQYDMKWFPLLIVGSAYALPDWFADSEENVGFVCLEHGLSNPIQSIWSPYHKRHVTRFLTAFGNHYEPMEILQGVRLGPSGNFGESQYPAGGNWGYRGEPMHIHIGFWAGDQYAQEDFRAFLRDQYRTIDRLNQAWDEKYGSFDEIEILLPQLCRTPRHRIDTAGWYTKSMSDWCEWWGLEARRAMPNTIIYQSAGGWGFLEAGTNFADQAKSMSKIDGGIRLSNETDSFHENTNETRLAATAARLYGIRLGYEPASSHTGRGTTARIFNTTSTNGDHFFTYGPNLFNRQYSIDNWLANFHYFDTRQDPIIDVALYYPETMNQLDDGAFRHLYAGGFYPRAREIRDHIEVDYLNETLIRDGFLDRYKVLVCIWGGYIEADVQMEIDRWLRAGGTIIYPSFPKGPQQTIEGDTSVFSKWSRGDCGQGAFYRFPGDMAPHDLYSDFAHNILQNLDNLHPWTRLALQIEHPKHVFFSVQQDGHLLAMNYGDAPAEVKLDGVFSGQIAPYTIARFPLVKE
ncbi:MAG: beta-galactosidase [bacterium]